MVGLLTKLRTKKPKHCPRVKLGYTCHANNPQYKYICTDCGRGVQ